MTLQTFNGFSYKNSDSIIRDSLKKKKKPELQKLCEEYGLPKTGKKDILIDRIMNPNKYKKNKKANAGKREKKELKDISEHINNNTEIGKRLKKEFNVLMNEEILSVEVIGGRNKHYDLKITSTNRVYKVEAKGSIAYKPILEHENPWVTAVQFYNGNPKPFTLALKYSKMWYETYISSRLLKDKYNIQSDIPSYDEWLTDARRMGTASTPFVKELKDNYRKEHGPKTSMLKERIDFNQEFPISEEDLLILKNEIEPIYMYIMNEKEMWLQIHGDINNECYFKWTKGQSPPKIKKITIKTASPDIKFNCELESELFGRPSFEAHLRWGYGQGFTNLRLDFK